MNIAKLPNLLLRSTASGAAERRMAAFTGLGCLDECGLLCGADSSVFDLSGGNVRSLRHARDINTIHSSGAEVWGGPQQVGFCLPRETDGGLQLVI